MAFLNPKLAEVVKRDPRYAYEAYEFVFQALHFTQKLLGRESPGARDQVGPKHHVSGPELLRGIRELALLEFGMLAKTVFHQWGIRTTDDFGNIVFNLIEAELMSKTDNDSLNDFHNVYDLNEALEYRITLDEAR